MSADDWILRLKNSVHVRLDQIRDAREAEDNLPKRRVKIAVLDTGIDASHEFIKSVRRRIKDRKSFVRDDVSIEDNDGHGTHVAALLLDVAPDAEVYIAKVATHVEIPSGHKIADVSCPLLFKCYL
jgi:subtilisin family serine protease